MGLDLFFSSAPDLTEVDVRPALMTKEQKMDFPLSGAALILAAATLAVFGHFLNPKGIQVLSLLGEDLSDQFVWWRQFGFDQLRQGHLALWDPHLYAGAPFFAGFQSALLYPPNWLYMILPLAFAINFGIILHVFLAGFCAYLWIRFRGFHPAACFLAAFMFMFGGAYFLHIVPGHLPNLCTMAWIPLVFLAVDGYTRDRSFGWVGLGVSAFSLQILAGHIQYFYYTVLVVGLYLLVRLPGRKEIGSYCLGPLLMLVGACLVTAVQTWTGFETAWEGLRGQHLSLQLIASNDLMPERLWSWFLPGFYGDWHPGSYWGGGMYWESGLFVSVTAFALAVYGLVRRQEPGRKGIAGLILFLVLLALGKRTPLFMLFYHFCPLFQYFRGVGKLNIFITLLICLLAAGGLDHYLKSKDPERAFGRWVLGACLFVFGIGLLFHFAPVLGLGRLLGKFGSHLPGMVKSLLGCALVLGLLALGVGWGRRSRWARYGLLILAWGELFLFTQANLPSFNLGDLQTRVGEIEAVYQKDPGDYRVLVDPTNDVLGTSGSDIWGNDPSVSFRYARFICASQQLDVYADSLNKPLFHCFPRMLGMPRLRYIFTPQGGGWKIKKTTFREQARVSLVSDWRMASGDSALKQLAGPKFNFTKNVLLESDPGFVATPRKPQGLVQWKDLSTDQMEIEAENSKPCLLVVGDNYAKGWRVKADPDDSQGTYRVMPANFFQRGIPLKAGHHHFVLEYLPRSFVIGKWISIGSLILWAVLGLVWVSRRCWRVFRKPA